MISPEFLGLRNREHTSREQEILRRPGTPLANAATTISWRPNSPRSLTIEHRPGSLLRQNGGAERARAIVEVMQSKEVHARVTSRMLPWGEKASGR